MAGKETQVPESKLNRFFFENRFLKPVNISGIFLKSNLGKRIANNQFNIPPAQALPGSDIVLPCVILGDEAFGLHENLMKPYPRGQSLHDKTKAAYNYRHSRARRTSENAFGILCAAFRIFHTAIVAEPKLIDNIIIASCILHNLIRNSRQPKVLPTDRFPMPTENVLTIAQRSGRYNNVAIEVRNSFKNYFNGSGAVSWQDRAIGTDY